MIKLKEDLCEQQTKAAEEEQKLLNSHIEKLQGIIKQKTELNGSLDSHNQSLHQEASKVRHQLSEMEAQITSERNEFHLEIQHLRRELMEKQNSLETGLSEARREHDREKKALER